ncbi:hypothetical protein J2X56_001101 [Herbaspirillum sp. 1173]|uniref:SHOCT domain-containing protein n=1 Tax=Herbaspirillum sp. 1173 TaxID=2817734 RepID=UPI0028576FC3|nr:SHOCT domain-containing protein [Herbaspirillum sp. 1173]MDR6739115.1 hypothetical protein [Herbaspirillum sp. 1173]
MENKALSSGDQSKIVLFSLLMIPTLPLFVGILPVFFLLFGVFMMRRSGDFSYIRTTVKIAKGYVVLIMIVVVVILLIATGTFGNEKPYDYDSLVIAEVFFLALSLFYYCILDRLYWRPLEAHQEWVARNGIFATKEKPLATLVKNPSTKVVHAEKLASFSVADELLKWAKLREEGHITEEEYSDARNKLLNK